MFWLGTLIFITTYLVIASEKVNKTVAAMAGGMLMLLTVLREGYHTELDPFSTHVDFDVIFTLAGMMVLVNLLSETGLFEYVAIKSAKLAKGSPVNTLVLLVVATAVLSAFLDNVTTVLLIAPVTLVVAGQLKVNPIPFLMAETLASNIGGAATLIGDPPNLIIGSKAGLSFGAFMINMAPTIVIMVALYATVLYFFYRNKLKVTVEQRAQIMEFNEKDAITNYKLLKRAGLIMGITLVGFLLHGVLHLKPSVVAMSGATAGLLFCTKNVEHALAKIEWETLFFFIGLFILVRGADQAGLMATIGDLFNKISHWHPLAFIIFMVWICGIGAAIMNNVSFTAAIVIIMQNFMNNSEVYAQNPALQSTLWWALAFSVCLAGNGTAVGAAANLVTIGIAEKSGINIKFSTFIKYGLPVTVVTLMMTTVYVVIRYHLLCN